MPQPDFGVPHPVHSGQCLIWVAQTEQCWGFSSCCVCRPWHGAGHSLYGKAEPGPVVCAQAGLALDSDKETTALRWSLSSQQCCLVGFKQGLELVLVATNTRFPGLRSSWLSTTSSLGLSCMCWAMWLLRVGSHWLWVCSFADRRSHKAAGREKRLCVVPVYTDDKQKDIPANCNADWRYPGS